MAEPTVLQGVRAPRAIRIEETKQADARAAGVNPGTRVVPNLAGDGKYTVYRSHTLRYRVQITAPQTIVLSDGRKQTGGRMLVAQFEDGRYINNDRNAETRKLIDEELQANKFFGEFGSHAHFWLASDQQAKMEKVRVEAALQTLKSLPREAVDRFVGELKQGAAADHAVAPVGE